MDYCLYSFGIINACWRKRTSFALPHDILPSLHAPLTQDGPQVLNRLGATFKTSSSMRHATSLISHWARLQHLKAKKCISSRAFMVIINLVSAAFGKTNRASSLPDSPAPSFCCQPIYQLCICSIWLWYSSM